jgi:alkaline phosphatase
MTNTPVLVMLGILALISFGCTPTVEVAPPSEPIANKNKTSLNTIEQLAGKKAIKKTPPGQYINVDGSWRKVSKPNHEKIKNVIFVIGDGMGPQALGLLNSYAKYAPNSIYREKSRTTALEQAIENGVLGLAYHESKGALVADSASSATQIASGQRALSETIGINQFGNPIESILKKAQKMGKSTGLVSDTRITHATPAAFVAHQVHRSNEQNIAVELLTSNVDVMLSGGLRYWLPANIVDPKTKAHQEWTKRAGGGLKILSGRKDDRNLVKEAEKRGYTAVFTKDQLLATKEQKILGLFASSYLPYRIDFDQDNPKRTIPQLKELTAKALNVLSKNEKGFFLMVESGNIDKTEHDNDAGAMLHEMIRLDETVACILKWIKGRQDTLLIITADHETGGFGFSYSRRNIPKSIPFPGNFFQHETFSPRYNFGKPELLDQIFAQKESFKQILAKFDALPESERTASSLAHLVNNALEFSISVKEASRILEREKNDYFVEGHKYLSSKTFPKVNDFKEFYVHGEKIRRNLLAKIVAKSQNTVWATATHTNTPVPLIVLGPQKVAARFGKLMHTSEWSQLAIDILSGK